MVAKFRELFSPKSRPANTNISIREMPVMISGLIMGILVTVSRAAWRYLLRRRKMPTAAAVPMTVAIRAEDTASTRVLRSASRMLELWKSSAYHWSEKPLITAVLLVPLKE